MAKRSDRHRLKMPRIYTWLMALALLLALAAGLRASTRAYQFTGVVKSLDGSTLIVEKNAKETWQFDLPKDVKGETPKVGDRVTVHYKMTATEIVK